MFHKSRSAIDEVPARYVALVDSGIGSTIEESSFSSLLTRVEIGHMRIRPAGQRRLALVRSSRWSEDQLSPELLTDPLAIHRPAGKAALR
jgi:hypothetical protein